MSLNSREERGLCRIKNVARAAELPSCLHVSYPPSLFFATDYHVTVLKGEM